MLLVPRHSPHAARRVSIPLQHRPAPPRPIDEDEGGTVLCPACVALLGCPVCFALYAGTPPLEPEDGAGDPSAPDPAATPEEDEVTKG